MVPGSLGLGSVVLAAITTLAPSAAARLPIARPMPRDAPVMNRVLPLSVIEISWIPGQARDDNQSHLREVGLALFHEGAECFLGRRLAQHPGKALSLIRHLLQHQRLMALFHQSLGLYQRAQRLGG